MENLSDTDKISVIIPMYNAEDFLSETLDSVLCQTLNPYEIFLVDDGSTDNTVDIAQTFIPLFNEKKINFHIIKCENKGPSAARNIGAYVSSGKYLAFLDADDIWEPTKLELQLQALKNHPNAAFCYTDYCLFGNIGEIHCKPFLRNSWAFEKTVGKEKINNDLIVIESNNKVPVLYDSYIQPSCVLMRSVDFQTINGFNDALRVAEDYEFFLRLFNITSAIVIMQPLMLYRKHANQATSNGPLNKKGLLKAANLVLESPHKYPSADVVYLTETEYLRNYNLGMAYARIGEFHEAIHNFEISLSLNASFKTKIALALSYICNNDIGYSIFNFTKTMWKKFKTC